MSAIAALSVALPLLGAAAIAAFGRYANPHVLNLAATAVAGAVTVVAVLLVLRSANHDLVYWFGGWRPRHGIAIGIAFTVDPFGAALAALAGALMTAALVFSYSYFE